MPICKTLLVQFLTLLGSSAIAQTTTGLNEWRAYTRPLIRPTSAYDLALHTALVASVPQSAERILTLAERKTEVKDQYGQNQTLRWYDLREHRVGQNVLPPKLLTINGSEILAVCRMAATNTNTIALFTVSRSDYLQSWILSKNDQGKFEVIKKTTYDFRTDGYRRCPRLSQSISSPSTFYLADANAAHQLYTVIVSPSGSQPFLVGTYEAESSGHTVISEQPLTVAYIYDEHQIKIQIGYNNTAKVLLNVKEQRIDQLTTLPANQGWLLYQLHESRIDDTHVIPATLNAINMKRPTDSPIPLFLHPSIDVPMEFLTSKGLRAPQYYASGLEFIDLGLRLPQLNY